MERRTRVLLGLGLVLVLAVAGALSVTLVPGEPTLAETWATDPPAEASGNHHAPAVGTVDGRALVFAPVNGHGGSQACRLDALEAATGEAVWHHQVPPTDCTVHAVADPTLAEWDGRPSVFVATTEQAVFDLDPATGDVRARYELPSYGYAPPVVADLVPGGGDELLVVDARGTVQVIGSDGAVVWREHLGSGVSARPVVGDLAATGEPRVAVGTGAGRLVILAGNGTRLREVEAPFDGAVTWLTAGQLDADPAVELVAATARGRVVVLDAATGAEQWHRSFDDFAAVGAVGDADGDGRSEVYATAADGLVRGLEGDTGRTIWEREVAVADVQMTPPPAFGDVTGDGVEELVVASNDGRVVVLEPATGTRLATYERDGRVFVAPTLADVDGDRGLEVFVTFADGTVVRLDFKE